MTPVLIVTELSAGGDRRPASPTYPVPVGLTPAPVPGSNGLSFYSNTALSNTKQQVKAEAATLYGYHFTNGNAAFTYIQIFNKLAANVTVGTTVPDFVLSVPASGVLDVQGSLGIDLSVGFTIAATTTATGSTAPATAAVNCALFYK